MRLPCSSGWVRSLSRNDAVGMELSLTTAANVHWAVAIKTERRAKETLARGQNFLFEEMSPAVGIEDEEGGHHNLRRGLKAEASNGGSSS